MKFDGSFGRNDALPCPTFLIPAEAGKQAGGNLFHSFSEFNLVSGDTGSFQGPSGVKNIIARVTGGRASSIDGTLRSEIPDANLYFLNPSGVLFGPNARLDLSGSLIVSTADCVKLADSGIFNAHPGGNDLLTSTPVSASGFFTAKPAAIALDGAAIEAPGGLVTLFSARSSGVVAFDLTNPGAGYRTAAFGAFGNITLEKSSKSGVSSNVNIDGPGGGRIVIRGRKLAVSGESSIRADNSNSSQAGGDVTIKVDHLSVSGSAASGEQSKIEVTTTGDGAGGNLQIDAGSVEIATGGAGGNIGVVSDFFLKSSSFITATGAQAGTVTIAAPELDLTAGPIELPASFFDASTQLREQCARRLGLDFSSLLFLGRSGVEPAPEDSQTEVGATATRPRK